MCWKLDDLHSGRPFDQLNFIAVGSIDEDESTPRRRFRWSVGDLDPLRRERGDCFIKALDLKGKMDQVFLDLYRSAGRETGQFNQFVAIGYLQEGEVGATRRSFSLNHFKAKYGRIELNVWRSF
jgi:hypothetical protein